MHAAIFGQTRELPGDDCWEICRSGSAALPAHAHDLSYDFPLDKLGHFDLILCMGFIHRIPDPFSVISRLTKIGDVILLEFKALTEYAYDRPFLIFDGRRSDPEDIFSTCYFVPSVRAIVDIAKQLGFEHYGIVGDPDERRVMLIVSNRKLAIFDKMNNLRKVSNGYLVKKCTRRFVGDIIKVIKGDFAE